MTRTSQKGLSMNTRIWPFLENPFPAPFQPKIIRVIRFTSTNFAPSWRETLIFILTLQVFDLLRVQYTYRGTLVKQNQQKPDNVNEYSHSVLLTHSPNENRDRIT